MKIFYLITKSEIGGAQTHVAQLCKYFVSQGHEVVVMSAGDGWLKKTIQKTGGMYISNNFLDNSFNPFKILKASKEIKTALSFFKPDIFCCHSSLASFVGRLTVRNKIPTVFTAHGWDFAPYRPWLRRQSVVVAEKLAANFCSKIICVSVFVKNLALEYKITRDDKLSVIYNGVENIKKNDLVGEDIQKHFLKIIFVGRLAKPKNPFLLVQAYAKLSSTVREKCELVIVGDGPQKSDLVKLIIKLGLSDKVHLIGNVPRDEMLKLLANSDIMVLPSLWESFGLSVLEAMSLSIPVVVSNVGGLKELVSNNSGILIDTLDDLTTSLEKLLTDEKLRNELAARGYEQSKNFSIESMCQKTAELYKGLIRNI